MNWRKLRNWSIACLLALLFAGYASAFSATDRCKAQMLQDLRAHHVVGFDMARKKFEPDTRAMYTSVPWPFVVDVETSLPRDMHATIYRARFIALPWRVFFASRDAIHLV
jgi:hypothetical protein